MTDRLPTKGWITDGDSELFAWCLNRLMARFQCSIRVLELGVHEGETARGMKQYLDDRGWGIDYIGVDNFVQKVYPTLPLPGPLYVMDVCEAAELVESPILLIFFDACKCMRCTFHAIGAYFNLVPPGGFMVFHDTATADQKPGEDTEHKLHNPRGGIEEADLKGKGFRLVGEVDNPGNGIMVFERQL